MSKKMITPDYLFEVSWEVCNKIGGIHTVISTKAISTMKKMNDNYIVIGPDVYRDTEQHPEFIEDDDLFADWRAHAQGQGLMVRTGRWKIAGSPLAIIVDFTPFFSNKDEIFSAFWEQYKLDSLSGQWDYIEPTLFGYATGKAIESFIQFHGLTTKKVVAQFHEWMTGAGLLYLAANQPQVGTVFTTHATVVGRSLAGNYQPLYSKMDQYNGDEKAKELNIVAKQSMEKTTAHHADVFTTVSELTATECARFHGKKVDLLTPNGFDDSFVPDDKTFDAKHTAARKRLLEVASRVTGQELPEDSLLIATSGRYEFKNKGIDLFIDALGALNKDKQCTGSAVAFILIPAHHYGPRKDLQAALGDPSKPTEGEKYLTHYLHYAEHDPILKRIHENQLNNGTGDPVKVIFVPSYLKGDDGIFNLNYYDALIGFDLTVFPSYYEPWGYTPLESLAFSIPSVTTTLTGFGRWVNNELSEHGNGIMVIPRDDFNDNEVANNIANAIHGFCSSSSEELNAARLSAFDISRIALWKNLIANYWEAYSLALDRSQDSKAVYVARERVEQLPETEKAFTETRPLWRKVLVQQNIPDRLKPLEELSQNLWWSWNQDAIDLFASIDDALWSETDENPIVLLDRMPYDNLIRLIKNKTFMEQLDRVYSRFTEYMEAAPRKNDPSVAYFSMEFGLHNSLKIYSGGLGLLAGDYLKEASDYNYNMVGVGLLYKYGYFQQVISSSGDQEAYDDALDFSRLPVFPVRDSDGRWKTVQVVLPGRNLTARIWRAQVGRIPLYLLDADIEANKPHDRVVTHKLYGGDHENRFKQELLLGIGGIRALRATGIDTDLYHINEGHAAFIGLERLRELIQEKNMTFPEAVEVVRASSLFTTHTPVPAGHDSFDENMMRTYISHYPERLKINWNRLMNLGRYRPNNSQEKFSMSVLAVNLSQEVNGVSKLHGRVSKQMFSGMWSGYMTDELHIGYVTNGVHVPTWLSSEWRTMYEDDFGKDFLEHQDDRSRWKKIHKVPDERIWEIRSKERAALIDHIKERLSDASARRLEDPRQMVEIANSLDKDALTIGFARRFATYKRAHLLFRDLERLARIVNNEKRPVQFIFAGKAHPNDKPGQDLIKMIVEISKRPEFTGKIIFLQNYNIQLAKRLLHGVDIWLNTPTRPLEASGTSGEKAVMNGGIHFSVLDGWWAEGYREGAGYALPLDRTFDNQEHQDELDSERIYYMLENDITNKFYHRNGKGVPEEWVEIIKNSIAEVAPEFTMNRMLLDYINRFYSKLYKRTLRLRKDDYQLPRELSYYKKQILDQWKNIQVVEYNIPDPNKEDFKVGQTYTGSVKLDLNGLSSDEIGVEMVMVDANSNPNDPVLLGTLDFVCTGVNGSVAEYTFVQQVGITGEFDIGFRIYPRMDEIPHRMDFPLVKWI
jgi:phosphorylase/glycogen(starch) synthase